MVTSPSALILTKRMEKKQRRRRIACFFGDDVQKCGLVSIFGSCRRSLWRFVSDDNQLFCRSIKTASLCGMLTSLNNRNHSDIDIFL